MMRRTNILLLLIICGCYSRQAVNERVRVLWDKHGVQVFASNELSRCVLFGDIGATLRNFDREMDTWPVFFKENIGPIVVCEGIADEFGVFPFSYLIEGYVKPDDVLEYHAIYIKNRSWLERLLFLGSSDMRLLRHEATHSCEFNLRDHDAAAWRAFAREFDDAGRLPYCGWLAVVTMQVLPPLYFARLPGFPSWYAMKNHGECVAETHCYMWATANPWWDATLTERCRLVREFFRLREEDDQ